MRDLAQPVDDPQNACLNLKLQQIRLYDAKFDNEIAEDLFKL